MKHILAAAAVALALVQGALAEERVRVESGCKVVASIGLTSRAPWEAMVVPEIARAVLTKHVDFKYSPMVLTWLSYDAELNYPKGGTETVLSGDAEVLKKAVDVRKDLQFSVTTLVDENKRLQWVAFASNNYNWADPRGLALAPGGEGVQMAYGAKVGERTYWIFEDAVRVECR